MKIAVLGAGNAGVTTAADLSIKGHDVTLIKTSNSLHNDNFSYLQKNNNIVSLVEGEKKEQIQINKISNEISLISEAEIVIVYIQTNYQEELIERIIPFLKDKQIVVFNPGYLATALMLKHKVKQYITIVEAESSFIDCRITSPGEVSVSFRNVRNPVGVFPSCRLEYAKEKMDELGYSFEYLKSVIEAALHNPNLIVHTVGAIMSIPRIEKTNGNYCMYKEVFSPSIWNLLESLDNEKMAVLEKLGLERLSYVDACKYRNSLDLSRNSKEVFFDYAMSPTVVTGPNSVKTRYITEDVSQGLVMLESLANELSVKVPITTALINIASACLKIDFRANGRDICKLGKDNIRAILADVNIEIL